MAPNRRDLIKTIGAFAAAAMVPHDAIAAWARVASGFARTRVFSDAQVSLIGAIADTLIPRTSTPGALDVGVPAFVSVVVAESYTADERSAFVSGLAAIEVFLRDRQGRAFTSLDAASRGARIADIENHGIIYRAVSKVLRHGEPRRTYWKLKELIVHGYFTSESVEKQVLEASGRA